MLRAPAGLALLLVTCALPLAAQAGGEGEAAMVAVPGRTFVPPYATATGQTVDVATLELDTVPVTEADFLAAGSTPVHEHYTAAPAADAPASHSIYHLPGNWTDQDGRRTTLTGLAGRVQVVGMVYTHCTLACPRILAQMKGIEGHLPTGVEDEVGFVLISIDPERDTPERLRKFADDTRLDTERWTLLSGDDADVLALSVLLGVKYRATDDGEFSHSNVLTVLGRDGEIVGRVEGLNADVTPVLEAIEGAL